jgi:hypothetical protein
LEKQWPKHVQGWYDEVKDFNRTEVFAFRWELMNNNNNFIFVRILFINKHKEVILEKTGKALLC